MGELTGRPERKHGIGNCLTTDGREHVEGIPIVSTASIITINAGRTPALNRLLEGASRMRRPPECVVVQFGAETQAHTHLVREVRIEQPGLPLAAARNAGRRAAQGDILVFLDVDCIPSSDLVEELSTHIEAHDALICCEVTYLPGGAVVEGRSEAYLRRVGRRHPARVFPLEGIAPAPQPGLFWSLAFAVRTATFDRIGGFDEAFDGYGAEDTDFAFRAAALGVPVLFSAGGHAFHQRHPAHDPPLQHFTDIMRNARRFRTRHGFWPMQGWLDAFAELGLVSATAAGDYRITRYPTPDEIEASLIPPDRPF